MPTCWATRPRECVGLNYSKLIHADDLALAKEQAEGTRCPQDGYLSRRTPLPEEGRQHAVGHGLRLDPPHERTGQPLYLLVQMTDIEKQKRAEDELAASEQRWNHALESAGQRRVGSRPPPRRRRFLFAHVADLARLRAGRGGRRRTGIVAGARPSRRSRSHPRDRAQAERRRDSAQRFRVSRAPPGRPLHLDPVARRSRRMGRARHADAFSWAPTPIFRR